MTKTKEDATKEAPTNQPEPDPLKCGIVMPIAECMKQDRKRLHARALVGMSNPYEASLRPKLVMTTTGASVVDATRGIVRDLEQRGLEG